MNFDFAISGVYCIDYKRNKLTSINPQRLATVTLFCDLITQRTKTDAPLISAFMRHVRCLRLSHIAMDETENTLAGRV